MKRKIFSKLLMVALVIAAVGSFVSCKDYDDDINNLQKQIDAKAALSELTALQSTLEGKISSATAAAQKAAEDAAAKADASLKSTLEAAIADAKKAGTDAGTEAGKAIAAANAAQTTADAAAAAAKKADEDAKKALEEALKDIEAKYITKTAADEAIAAALKTVAENYATKAQAEEIKTELEGLKENLESAIEEKIAAAIAELGNAEASVKAIWSAITNVELYFTHNANGQAVLPTLNFKHGQIRVASVFGDEADYKDADKLIKYKENADDSVKFVNKLIVRVEPVNAEISDVAVKFINSKGEADLTDVVEFGTPERYTGLVTRADNNTGLWVIPVNIKKDVADKDLEKITKFGGKDVVFAISLNNTETEDRDVTSTFDLSVLSGAYVASKDFSFNIDKRPLTAIRNRWNGTSVKGEDQTSESSAKYHELKWGTADATKGIIVPDVEYTYDGTKGNALKEDRAAEKRYATADSETLYLFPTKVDSTFVINGVTGTDATYNQIQYYYATLDQRDAVESAPSEWVSWKNYEIDGLYKMTSVEEDLAITVKSAEADGDIIGIRVYAVNYDGTLADPDGKAFFIAVGEQAKASEKSATATVTVYNNTTTIVAAADAITFGKAEAVASTKGQKNAVIATIDGAALVAGGFADIPVGTGFQQLVTFTNVAAAGKTLSASVRGAKTTADVANVKVTYTLLTDNAKGTAATATTKWSKITGVAVAVENVLDWINGKTFDFKIESNDAEHHNRLANVLKLSIAKAFPAAPSGNYSWKTGREPQSGVLTLYPLADAAASAINAYTAYNVDLMPATTPIPANATGAALGKYAYIDLQNYLNILNADVQFKAFSKTEKDKVNYNFPAASTATKYDHLYNFLNGNPTYSNKIAFRAGLVTGDSLFAGEMVRVYKNINCPAKADGTAWELKDATTPINHADTAMVLETFDFKFADVITYYTWTVPEYTYSTAWGSDKKWGTKDDTKATSNALYVSYSAVANNFTVLDNAFGTYDDTTPVAYNANLFANLFTGSNSVIPSLGSAFANFGKFATAESAATVKIITISNNAENEFVSATVDATNHKLVFAKVAAAGPAGDIASKAVITVKTSFGKEVKLEIPFTLKP